MILATAAEFVRFDPLGVMKSLEGVEVTGCDGHALCGSTGGKRDRERFFAECSDTNEVR